MKEARIDCLEVMDIKVPAENERRVQMFEQDPLNLSSERASLLTFIARAQDMKRKEVGVGNQQIAAPHALKILVMDPGVLPIGKQQEAELESRER
jgi:hypothetical protein